MHPIPESCSSRADAVTSVSGKPYFVEPFVESMTMGDLFKKLSSGQITSAIHSSVLIDMFLQGTTLMSTIYNLKTGTCTRAVILIRALKIPPSLNR